MKASSSDQNYVCRRLTEIGRKECLGREHEEPPLEAGQGFHVHLFDGSHANALRRVIKDTMVEEI